MVVLKVRASAINCRYSGLCLLIILQRDSRKYAGVKEIKRKLVKLQVSLKIIWKLALCSYGNRQSRNSNIFRASEKSESKWGEKKRMSASFHCIRTEARGMKRYLGARGNTDALTFKKAASHSRQNHATPLPHCTARTTWCLQPPFNTVHIRLQKQTQKRHAQRKVHLCMSCL